MDLDKTLKGNYISMNNYILNLLNIKDKNIYICEKIDEKIIKGKNKKTKIKIRKSLISGKRNNRRCRHNKFIK